jgi:hypothetical protein
VTSYGFRLFHATVHRNGRGDPRSLAIGEGDDAQHFRDYLHSLALSRKDVVVHGAPERGQMGVTDDSDDVDEDIAESDDDADGRRKRSRPALVITDVKLRGDHIVIEFLYGKQLGYDVAGYSEERADAPPVPIKDLKSMRPYRAVFMFPDAGEAGVVAVEDANRTHAAAKLTQWLRAWAREDAAAVADQQREETGKKSIRPLFWSLRFTPLSDPQRLTRLIKSGESSKIILTKQGGSDGRTPGKAKLKIEMGLDEPRTVTRARGLITKWMPGLGPGGAAGGAQRDATRDLAALLADRYQGLDDEEFDDAWIEVRDSATGKPKQISPSRWADIFIYPVGSGTESPMPALFYGRVREAIEPLQNSLELSIDWAGWGDSG